MMLLRIAIASCLLMQVMALAAALPSEMAYSVDTNRYNLSLELFPAKDVHTSSTVKISLEASSSKDSLLVVLTKKDLALFRVQNGKRSLLKKIAPSGVIPGKPYRLTIMRRPSSLGFLHDSSLIYRHEVAPGPGKMVGMTMGKGWVTKAEPSIQRLEALYFEDDFMRRSDDDHGVWESVCGSWKLKSAWDNTARGGAEKFINMQFAQNPFAIVGSSPVNGRAVYTAGEPFWEDYTFSVNVQPREDGAVGLLVNMPDSANGLLVRWTPVSDNGRPGSLTLSRMENGIIGKPFAISPGGYLPGQWYRMTVISSYDGLQVLIDDVERIIQQNITPWRGGIGLYTEGTQGTAFDDVTVYGSDFNVDLLFETRQTKNNQRFIDDKKGMGFWANPKSEWMLDDKWGGRWHRHDLYGETAWMALTVKPSPRPDGELCMILNSDGQTPTKGLRAFIQLDAANPNKINCTLYHDEEKLAGATVNKSLDANDEYIFRFHREGARLRLELDGEMIIKADDTEPVSGLIAGYKASGSLSKTQDEVVMSRNALNYTFSGAPSDWLMEGTWEPSIRWSCDPEWSFWSGWSRGDAVMWHKQRFTGDQSFEAYVSTMMEYPREIDVYDHRFRDYGITICGDGKNPRSGYAGIYAKDKRIVLLRNGEIAASKFLQAKDIPGWGNHRGWFDLKLSKHGDKVEFTVTFERVPVHGPVTPHYEKSSQSLSFIDPDPLTGGVPAVWTVNNGISLARATISFATPPTPRNEPFVAIDQPWYREWANVGEPLHVSYANSLATSGKPVALQVTQRGGPPGENDSIKVEGKELTFIPKIMDSEVRNLHWYEIRATDGETTSPAAHLNLHIFDPQKYHRDDSHALLLYRFDEGKGDIVHDRSGISPAADLQILPTPAGKGLSARWLPGQGLNMSVGSRVLTPDPKTVNKLLAIQKTKACTIEMWISTDSIYPPEMSPELGQTCTVFSWDQGGKNPRKNLKLLQQSNALVLLDQNNWLGTDETYFYGAIRTGLEHVVITWDGQKTTAYINGSIRVTRSYLPWSVQSMKPDSALVLGNTVEPVSAYLGAFYLFAIHDRCFTAEEVMNNYFAGPSESRTD